MNLNQLLAKAKVKVATAATDREKNKFLMCQAILEGMIAAGGPVAETESIPVSQVEQLDYNTSKNGKG